MALKGIMTTEEAAHRWGRTAQTIKKACTGQRGKAPLFQEGEFAKSGRNWLVTYEAMMRVYGMERKKQVEIINQELELRGRGEANPDWITMNEVVIHGEKEDVIWYIEETEEAFELVYLISKERFLNDSEMEEFSKHFKG